MSRGFDRLTPSQRSALMGKIRGKNTKPELLVRRLVCLIGMKGRYRLHVKNLPGCPDLTFRSLKKVIFVHGCFWHLHECSRMKIPKTRRDYWSQKLKGNQDRDAKNVAKLRRSGWRVLILWECKLITQDIVRRLRRFLQEGDSI